MFVANELLGSGILDSNTLSGPGVVIAVWFFDALVAASLSDILIAATLCSSLVLSMTLFCLSMN